MGMAEFRGGKRKQRLRTCIVPVVLSSLIQNCSAQLGGPYELQENYMAEDFFERWKFYDGGDPTHGTVDFVTCQEARTGGLLQASPERIYIAADSTTVLAKGQGRKAVKILSNSVYNNGLFIMKADHLPTGCGTWPAWWMFGEDSQHAWPRWGEYDIFETVHTNNYATTTLHTADHCDQKLVDSGIDFTGQGWAANKENQPAQNCFVNAPSEYPNQGCGQRLPDGSCGPEFNKNGGGTYAAEWDPEGAQIRTWFFPHGQEPEDLKAKEPRPDSWGKPTSYFTLDQRYCSKSHFKNMRMVFDLTFCGDYGSPTFGRTCPKAGSMSCQDFVEQRPEEFKEAYWSIRAYEVYQKRYAQKYFESPLPGYGCAGQTFLISLSSTPSWVWFFLGVTSTGVGIACCLLMKTTGVLARGKSTREGPKNTKISAQLDISQEVRLSNQPQQVQQQYQQQSTSGFTIPFFGQPNASRSLTPQGQAYSPTPTASHAATPSGFGLWPQSTQWTRQPSAPRTSSGSQQCTSPTGSRGNAATFWNAWGQPQEVPQYPSPPRMQSAYTTNPATSPMLVRAQPGGSLGSFIMSGLQTVSHFVQDPQSPGSQPHVYRADSSSFARAPSPVPSANYAMSLPPTMNWLQPYPEYSRVQMS